MPSSGDDEPSVPGEIRTWFIFDRVLARVQSRFYCPTMANSGDDQELQNETTVRLMAFSLSEKAFVVVSSMVFGTTVPCMQGLFRDSACRVVRPQRTYIRFGHGHSVNAKTFSYHPFRSHHVEEREEV